MSAGKRRGHDAARPRSIKARKQFATWCGMTDLGFLRDRILAECRVFFNGGDLRRCPGLYGSHHLWIRGSDTAFA